MKKDIQPSDKRHRAYLEILREELVPPPGPTHA
jgi:hypothetical protein